MASEEDAEQSGAPNPRQQPAEWTALEERVGRLELELAALRRQIAAGPAAESAAVRSDMPPIPPPPPRPSPAAETVQPSAPARLPQNWERIPFRPAATHRPESRGSLESRLGSQVFNRIAIVLLLIGTAYALKLAVDRGLIGPTPRVIIGLIAGAALVVWSERFRRDGFVAFSYSLKALGSGVLYLSLWAGFRLYGLLPTAVALGLMVLVTAWNAFMAWAQDSELLAAYALAGGFATPMLLSTGGNHEAFLFTYVLAIVVATVILVRLRRWPRLLLGAFPLTVAYFVGWYAQFYTADELTTTSAFIALFGITFGSVAILRAPVAAAEPSAHPAPLATLLEDILQPLANAAFVALAFYSVLQDSGHHPLLPWLMILLAAAYLAVMRLPQSAVAAAIHLSLAVVFLTVAIPLKASGNWITVSWLVEGLALLWAATRLQTAAAQAEVSSAYASRTLRWLALGSLLLGFFGICVHLMDQALRANLSLLNKGTGTAVTGIVIFAAAAWLSLRAAVQSPTGEGGLVWIRITRDTFILIAVTAVLLTARELLVSWGWNASHPPFQSADFLTALLALAVFAGVIAASLRLSSERPDEAFWASCAALSTIAFNLIAVLTGVREISAIWESSLASPDAALQQALAISGFLMLYGAALLAAGFWKRSGFLRYQALALLVFTILKTFLYDMRNLSQGYRVASFLGLGALLMAISFAYQKDWLHLREPDAPAMPAAESDADSRSAR